MWFYQKILGKKDKQLFFNIDLILLETLGKKYKQLFFHSIIRFSPSQLKAGLSNGFCTTKQAIQMKMLLTNEFNNPNCYYNYN